MGYFQISNNGVYRAKIVCTELNRNSAIDFGEELGDIIRVANSKQVFVDFSDVRYAHKDCLIHMVAAAYEKKTNGTSPIRIINASQETLNKLKTLFPEQNEIYLNY